MSETETIEEQGKNSSNTVTISIKDMNLYIFNTKKKFVIILMLIFALVFGMIKGVSSFRKIGKVSASDADIATQNAYSESQKAYINDIDKVTNKINDEKEYMKNSILYNINAEDVHRAGMVYAVKFDTTPSEEGKETVKTPDSVKNEVVQTYVSSIKDASFYDDIRGADKAKYVRELIYVTADVQTKMLYISVVGPDDDMVKTIAADIEDVLNKHTERFQSEGIDCSLIQRSNSFYTTCDTANTIMNTSSNFAVSFTNGEFINVYTNKKSHDDTLTSLNSTLAGDNANLEALQNPNIDIAEVSSNDAIEATVKAVIEGLLLGFILAFLIQMIHYCHDMEKKKKS